MEQLRSKAYSLGATDFGVSKRVNKRFYVVYNNKIINFGSKVGHTYIDHGDKLLKKNWQARHSKIKNKEGQYVYRLKTSPDFWSWHILWN